jgi:hypothetical protein
MELSRYKSEKRPLGITLIGYLLLFTAVFQAKVVWQIFIGQSQIETFMGIMTSVPLLPEIEFLIKWAIYIFCGIGFMKFIPISRIVFLAFTGWNILSILIGGIKTLITSKREAALSQMVGDAFVPTATFQWLLTIAFSGIILIVVFIYVLRSKRYFVKTKSEDSDQTS